MKISDFCSQLNSQLAALPDADKKRDVVVETLRQVFKVDPSEVGILLFDAQAQALSFLWPTKLKATGSIPLSSGNSLAARTIREKKGFVNNRFASVSHALIFEQVRLDPEAPKGATEPIQKIISASMSCEGEVKGVLQICRKGKDSASAGNDFTQNDLAVLSEIAKVVGCHF